MRLVEQHIIEQGDPRLKQIDQAAFASKNLYNSANYLVRQSFIFQGVYLDKAWKAFFEAMAEWREHPEKFTGRPKLPGYKHKTAGRNLLVYEKGAIWKRELSRGIIAVSGLGELVKTKQTRQSVDQVRIVPKRRSLCH
jgi:putative transposase